MSENTTDPLGQALGARRFGRVNWLGLWTLYLKETRRFMKVGVQTIAAPVISSLLFLIIFKLALGRFRPDVDGIPFADFLAPGLIMMAILTNAFANSSSSLLSAKMQGNLTDILMPPLSPGELTVAYVLGGATRGAVVAIATALAMMPFVNFNIGHWWAVTYFAIIASVIMAEIGVLAGVWAEKFDHMAVVTNFVVTPLVFLSGTFYSVKMLPPAFFAISQWNPFFYLIDGFRYGVIDRSDGSPTFGALAMLGLAIVLGWSCQAVLKSGWRIKS